MIFFLLCRSNYIIITFYKTLRAWFVKALIRKNLDLFAVNLDLSGFPLGKITKLCFVIIRF